MKGALGCLELLVAVWLVVAIVCRTSSAAAAATYPTGVYEAQWKLWKSAEGKSYLSTKEEVLRYSIWLDNMDYIEQHNKNAEQHGFSLKMNSFGDLV